MLLQVAATQHCATCHAELRTCSWHHWCVSEPSNAIDTDSLERTNRSITEHGSLWDSGSSDLAPASAEGLDNNAAGERSEPAEHCECPVGSSDAFARDDSRLERLFVDDAPTRAGATPHDGGPKMSPPVRGMLKNDLHRLQRDVRGEPSYLACTNDGVFDRALTAPCDIVALKGGERRATMLGTIGIDHDHRVGVGCEERVEVATIPSRRAGVSLRSEVRCRHFAGSRSVAGAARTTKRQSNDGCRDGTTTSG